MKTSPGGATLELTSNQQNFMTGGDQPKKRWRIERAKCTKNAVLRFKEYVAWSETWDHDHCLGCWAKFMDRPECLTEGYATEDNYHWICPKCFQEMKDEIGWTLA